MPFGATTVISSSLTVQIWSVSPAAMAGERDCQRRCPSFTATCKVLTERVKTHDPILPGTGGLEHGALLRERQGFPHQAPVHLPARQIRPLDVGGMRTYLRTNLLGSTIHHLDRHAREAIAGSVFDDLEIVPIRLRLFARWRAALPAILRHLAPRFNQRIAVAALAISRHRRRGVGMPATLQLGHQGRSDLLLGLGDCSTNPQAGVALDGDAAPEGAAIVLFRPPPFSPLWP